MQRFDCLAKNCPLFGPHLLEASAGTGKTFSIEHIFVRLILESIEVEQILAVTFTRAAARELKARIRSNIERALTHLKNKEPVWEYLHAYLEAPKAIHLLTDALASFDRCQIFTIHGFCYRMLKEFAFEAKIGALSNPDEGKKVPEALRQTALDFLESGLDPSLVCPELLTLLFKEFENVDDIIDDLLVLEKKQEAVPYLETSAKCKAALHPWHLTESKLLEDFYALAKGYKAMKGDFETQVRALANTDLLPALFKERGTLFDFLDPSNRKIKAQEPSSLHYPGFFDWARIHIAPLITQKVFPILHTAWLPIAQKILAQEEYLDPDEILLRMKKAVENETFATCIRSKYTAAIIDEFQDTDAMQWDIFQRLFLEHSMKALYLVGDPKQSIYRFRKADVYTYLKARDSLGENNLYQLDTNFRSSKSLIGALNALFSREWLKLPKVNRTLAYHPVKAGLHIESTFDDSKGALHFFIGEGEPNHLFEDAFLPYTIHEIERLKLKKCAILVKDRYQAQKTLELLKKRNLSAVAKSHTPLGQTVAFQAIRELFDAVLSPRDASATKIVLAGPFAKSNLRLYEYKALLEEKGLVPFAKEFHLDSDAMQIFELLFEWEKKEGFSFEGLKRFLTQLEEADDAKRRMEVDDEAVQIMTMHISKGLEFDVVFALGLISRTPESEEIQELDAEKLRQLYVAMTRAKKRLYIPFALSQKDPDPGTHSPLELFSRSFDGPFLDQLQVYAKTESLTLEHIQSPFALGPPTIQPIIQSTETLIPRPTHPSFLYSFTTLARTKETELKAKPTPSPLFTLDTMPRGSETGILIHKIFEELFRSSKPIWRDPHSIDSLVAAQVQFSPLAPWKECLQQMVRQTVTLPLHTDGKFFTLSEIEKFQVETEFLFTFDQNYVKGFIDLIFRDGGKMYFVDWKTNWLEDYTPDSLLKTIEAHDYGLQAELYTEAIRRHFNAPFGGAYYLFVRGGVYYKL